MSAFDLQAVIQERKSQGLYRRPRVLDGPTGPRATEGGRGLLVFCSNDYLGLASDPRIAHAMTKAASEGGTGSGGAHLVSGHRQEHEALEAELSDFLGRERTLLFSTGYAANLGVIDALLGRGDGCFQDRLNHASLLDGARLSGARLIRYRHADVEDLASRLHGSEHRQRLVVTDGVFSMDGDTAPLRELAVCARDNGAWLMVDDAHGIGVTGPGAAGSVAAAGLGVDEVPVLVGTLGKAFGTFGAFVSGSAELVEYLVQCARTYIYTTAPPPSLAAASRVALRLVRQESWRRDRLQALIHRFRQGAEQLDLALMPSTTPIQPLVVGEADAAVAASEGLEARGFLVTAIRPPTVPAGTARLRITLSAAHSDEQVDRLLDALAQTPELSTP